MYFSIQRKERNRGRARRTERTERQKNMEKNEIKKSFPFCTLCLILNSMASNIFLSEHKQIKNYKHKTINTLQTSKIIFPE